MRRLVLFLLLLALLLLALVAGQEDGVDDMIKVDEQEEEHDEAEERPQRGKGGASNGKRSKPLPPSDGVEIDAGGNLADDGEDLSGGPDINDESSQGDDNGEGEDGEDGEQEEPPRDYSQHTQEYVVDQLVDMEGELVATLIVDEITEYFDEDDSAWYKVQMHLQNRGTVDMCGVTLEVSNVSLVAETWTLERIGKKNLYELLFSYNITSADPKKDSRYFGIITHGSVVPDIHIHAVTPCDGEKKSREDGEDDGEDDEEDEEGEEGDAGEKKGSEPKDDPNAPAADGRRRLAGDSTQPKQVTLQVDGLSEWVDLVVDEAQRTSKGPDGRRILLNAHVTNNAPFPICGIGLWVYNLENATEHWGLVSHADDATGGLKETVTLPSAESRLDPSQSHYFGVHMPLDKDFPNLMVVKAQECAAESSPQ